MARPTSISIAITTFNRPEGCLRLLRDIERNAGSFRLRVTVFDDGSTESYQKVQGFLRSKGWQWVRAEKNGGKRNWWRLVSSILGRWAQDAADIFYFLQDDIRLCDDFFTQTLTQWRQIADPKKVTLYLLRDQHRDRMGIKCWTDFPSRVEGTAERTQWCDCAAFMANPKFIKILGGKLTPIPTSRWKNNPARSSGVGEQWSRRVHQTRWSMYRTLHSYVLHIDDDVSLMNPEERAVNPMRAVRFIDGPVREQEILSEYETVTVSLATIPSRRAALKQVVGALLPQVDRLNVYLNATPAIPGGDGYPNLPNFLRHPKVTAIWSRDTEFGDQGDAGKAYWASEIDKGYHIICDDDVAYPPDFVEKLIEGLRRYDNKVVAGFHGVTLAQKFVSYYSSRRSYHFGRYLAEDTPCHIIAGAGGIAYHTDTLRVHRDDFKHPNMGDIWLALLQQQQRVPSICLAHEGNWITNIPATGGDSIYAHSKKRKKGSWKNTADKQTEVVKANMPWHVWAADGRIVSTVGRAAASPTPRVVKPAKQHKAVFLVASTNRPLLLAAVLRSLQNQVEVPDWDIDILVSGAADDSGRIIAELAGVTYLVCDGPYPGHKINTMLRATDAELVMLADDDDLQSPYRAKASIEALGRGALWSSTSGFWCLDVETGRVAWWKGPQDLVGTTVSVRRDVALKSDGWPARKEGKDGLFTRRLRQRFPKAACYDLSTQIGLTTVTMQHAANIHRRRPFPARGVEKQWGKFKVTGQGIARDLNLPDSLAAIVRGVTP